MHVMIAGATGLVGGAFLHEMVKDSRVSKISLLVRREVPELLLDERVEAVIVRFPELAEREPLAEVDIMVCALGSTIKKAGTKERLFEIDCLYTEAAACYAKRCGATQLLAVSSIGASPRASSHYLQTKGEMERRLKALGFHGSHIFRPSLLLGDRQESRFGESLAARFMAPLSGLIPKAYRPVEASLLAQSMADIAFKGEPGGHFYTGSHWFS